MDRKDVGAVITLGVWPLLSRPFGAGSLEAEAVVLAGFSEAR